MRKVPLEQLTADMHLGRTVYRGVNVLIRSGTTDLDQFAPRLKEMGISYLYIEDAASEGIEFDDLISERTRMQCKKALDQSFRRMRSKLALDVGELAGTVETVMDEVMCRPRMLVSLSEIGGIGDNTLDHSVNTTIYAVCLGRQLGYSRSKIAEIAQGTLLHDIGKTLLDSCILFKPGRLTEEEFAHVKQHPQMGYDILKTNRDLSELCRQVCLYHHERLDGSGYPYGLRGDEVPEFARITAIVDVYEALTVDRCYHKAIAPQQAVEVLGREAATGLDLEFTSRFMQNVAVYPNGTTVLLSTGEYAVVQSQNQALPQRPVLRLVRMERGVCLPVGVLDLSTTLNVTIVSADVVLPKGQ